MPFRSFLELRSAHYWKIYPLAVYPGMLALVANAALVVLRPLQVDPGFSQRRSC